MESFVAYQDIECVYPMSGLYGRAPRTLYYALLLFVVIFRRQDWLAAGAAGACLILGGSAAIHALILAPILSLGTSSVPDGLVQLSNSTEVTIRALVTDLDSDATLAVVGTGFLLIMPMAIWSEQLRRHEALPVLILWIILMFVGMVCCMVNLYGVDGSAAGPLRQFRFCSPGYENDFRLNDDPIEIINHSWNETIWNYFNNTEKSRVGCLYPCLTANELLRQPEDVKVIAFDNINPSETIFWVLDVSSALIYGCVPFSIILSLILLFLRMQGYSGSPNPFATTEEVHGWRAKCAQFLHWAIYIYGRLLTPFVVVAFLIWVEWIIWYDVQSETLNAVGQWTPLLGAGLVFISAFVSQFRVRIMKLPQNFRIRRRDLRALHDDESIAKSIQQAFMGHPARGIQVNESYLESLDGSSSWI